MKKHIFILFGIAILLVSCHNLDPKVFDKISPENYPSNLEDINSMITGVYGDLNRGSYTGLGDISQQSRLIMNTATTDEFYCSWRNNTWKMYEDFTWLPTSAEVTAKTYINYTQLISRCVSAIDVLEHTTIPIKDDLRARYIGEMQTIIAMHIYFLYDFYGPVAVVLDPSIIDDGSSTFVPERQTKEWTIDKINELARAAADVLPVHYENYSDYGRMTKGTSLMIMLKLAMHEREWQKALDLIEEIEGLNHYELQPSYISVFSVANEGNNEVILAVPNLADGDRHNNWLAHILPPGYVDPNGYSVTEWGGGYKMPWPFYDKYWDFVGEPGSAINDERVKDAIFENYINDKGEFIDIRELAETAAPTEWPAHGVIPYKYPADPAGVGTNQGNDYVIFRYADVLLYKAECINNLRPMDQEVIDILNQIRARAKTTLVSLSDFSNQQELNDFILDERGRELFMEGTRREDLIRHGKYLQLAADRGAVFTDETRLIFPIPQHVINQSKGRLKQNPGY